MIAVFDVGASKTHAAILSSEGNILEEFVSEGANYLNSPFPYFIKKIKREIGSFKHKFNYICIAAAGLSLEKDQIKVKKEIGKSCSQIIYCTSDADLAFGNAFQEKEGLLAIMGTGSILLGKKADGSHFRYGGNGYLFDHFSGGFTIGRLFLKEVIGEIEKNELDKNFAEYFFKHREQVEILNQVKQIYQNENKIKFIASFSKSLIEFAENGNSKAEGILMQAFGRFRTSLLEAIQIHRIESLPLCISGGIVRNLFVQEKLKLLLDMEELSEIRFIERSPIYAAYHLRRKFFNL